MITIDGKVKTITGAGWRLVHDDVTVLALIKGEDTTVTTTIQNVLEFATKEAVLAEIETLGLIYGED